LHSLFDFGIGRWLDCLLAGASFDSFSRRDKSLLGLVRVEEAGFLLVRLIYVVLASGRLDTKIFYNIIRLEWYFI
jgi:hypothetical protein